MSQEQPSTLNNLGVERFRILVIGNANAGKTTILEKVCHARDRNPIYLDDKGNEIKSELKPSLSRGEHNIEHQFQYPTAHGFVFHDSRGFEAGGADELKKVKDFIENRAKSEQSKDQLHAIWHCLPTSNDRGMTDAEMSLFESGTGNVPVIAIFTKMDALYQKAFNELMLEGVPYAEAKEQAPTRAEAIFKNNYLRRLEEVQHKPRFVVQLRDMDKEGTDCDDLIVRTSQALDRDTLKLFCLSILRNSIESRIKQVITQIIIPQAQAALESHSFSEEQAKSLFCEVMRCFPHILPSFDKLIADMDKNAVAATDESVREFRFLRRFFRLRFLERRRLLEREFLERRRLLERELEREELFFLERELFERELFREELLFEREELLRRREERLDGDHLNLCFTAISSYLSSEVDSASPHCKVVWLSIATMAIIHYCLFTAQLGSLPNFRKAANFYMAASARILVDDVKEAFQGSTSITKGDSDKVSDILKNVLALVDGHKRASWRDKAESHRRLARGWIGKVLGRG